MKICMVIGARPQFIKASPVARAIAGQGLGELSLVHTGQHYDANMSAVFFAELGIPEPGLNLGVGSGAHGAMTGRMLERLEEVFLADRPDVVLVFGDTNSTLAAALAAAKLHIPVAHVEAGLRSFNRAMPEEINRILTDHASDLLFAPTAAGVENLVREGFVNVAEGGRMLGPGDADALTAVSPLVANVGDVMFDAALQFGRRAEVESAVLDALGLRAGEFCLATVHRAENTDDPARLRGVFAGLAAVADETPVVLPLHPRTRAVLAANPDVAVGGVRLVDPVGYLDMVMLERSARVVLTDSGGVQKEAYFHGVPCVTMRDETEWTELVDGGFNVVVGADPGRIAEGFAAQAGKRIDPAGGLYGTGEAGAAIAAVLGRFFG